MRKSDTQWYNGRIILIIILVTQFREYIFVIDIKDNISGKTLEKKIPITVQAETES